MIFNPKNTAGKKVTVFAHRGAYIVKDVKKYNTRTREVTIYVRVEGLDGAKRVLTVPVKRGHMHPRKIATVTIKIPDSYIVVGGKRY